MRILAIDPGRIFLSWALVKDGKVMDYGKKYIDEREDDGENDPLQFCRNIMEYFLKLLKKHKPDLVAIERMFINRTRDGGPSPHYLHFCMIETYGLAGRYLSPEKRTLIAPMTWKKEAIGNARATKDQVFDWVLENAEYNVGVPPIQGEYKYKKDKIYWQDCADAIGIGISAEKTFKNKTIKLNNFILPKNGKSTTKKASK